MTKAKLITAAALLSTGVMIASYVSAEVPVIDDSHNYIVASNQHDEQRAPQQQYVAAREQTDDQTVIDRLNALQDQVQRLQGQVDVQAHDLKMLQQQQQAFYGDLDRRISQLQGGATASSSGATPAANTPVAEQKAAPAQSSAAADPAAEQAKYAHAYELINNKKYHQAETEMVNFLSMYPNSQFSANARYWLGELYLTKGDTQNAIRQFKDVVSKNPKSNKVAAALLKLGFVYFDQGELVKSRETLQEVARRYPGTTSARLASNRLQAIDDVMK